MKRAGWLRGGCSLLAAGLAAGGAVGALFAQPPWCKALCAALALGGLGLGLLCRAVCRAQALEMAARLETAITLAEQGRAADLAGLAGETLTDRLCAQLARLARANQAAARRNEAQRKELQSTISDISHQLRAPAANMILYADSLAQQDLPPETRRRFAAIVSQQAATLRFLVEALAQMSRMESGVIQLTPVPGPLLPTLQQAARRAEPLAQAKGLAFTLDCPADLSLPHDARWTAEAVFNLMDNAVKYTDSGTVAVTAQSWESAVCIQVEDTGMGIDPGEAAKLFGRFYRAKAAQSRPGAGLGLYLARQIAARQGGYLQAKALPQGAAFCLVLPKAAQGESGGGPSPTI